jgi:hypothetical protein
MKSMKQLAVSCEAPEEGCPERHLVAAILEQAIFDCMPVREREMRKPVTQERMWTRTFLRQQRRRIRDEALHWCFGATDPDGNEQFSYEWCCAAVGYEPSTLRRRISATLRGNLAEQHLWIRLGHKWSTGEGRTA